MRTEKRRHKGRAHAVIKLEVRKCIQIDAKAQRSAPETSEGRHFGRVIQRGAGLKASEKSDEITRQRRFSSETILIT